MTTGRNKASKVSSENSYGHSERDKHYSDCYYRKFDTETSVPGFNSDFTCGITQQLFGLLSGPVDTFEKGTYIKCTRQYNSAQIPTVSFAGIPRNHTFRLASEHHTPYYSKPCVQQ